MAILEVVEPEAIFFSSAQELRSWLEQHHATETELWVGFYRKATGKQAFSWSEAVDQVLCFGWIDGVRRPLNDEAYIQRFTPRRPTSNWSAVNVAKVEELTKKGLMHPAGIAAFERRRRDKTAVYSYEQRDKARFDEEQLALFQKDSAAWEFFTSQAPWYRRMATYWVVSAKKPETRARRLATLIEDSAAGRRLRQLARPEKS